jgi:hypothetical protein
MIQTDETEQIAYLSEGKGRSVFLLHRFPTVSGKGREILKNSEHAEIPRLPGCLPGTDDV